MKIHNVLQGTPEWHALRAEHFTASDASAMMGVSKYQTRTELLEKKKTGKVDVVSPAQQELFDRGHAAEAAARPIIEKRIGEELYPVVGTRDGLLASLDGATMTGELIFEHKLWNAGLAAQVERGELEPNYYWQLEQQLYVSGAESCLFVVSDGTEENMVSMTYTAVPGRAEQLLAGWAQFKQDLAEFVADAPVVEAVGMAPEALPALRIEVSGMVTASNLDAFKANALTVFKSINTDLQTDQHFADAEKAVKWCSDVEDRLAAAKQHALSQTESIDALFRTIDEIAAEARSKRLELDKLVKARKTAIRDEIALTASRAFADHVAQINATLGQVTLPHVAIDVAGAIKGKKSISSLRDAASTELARAKIEASQVADKIRANLATLEAAGHAFLFADRQQLVTKAPDDLAALVKVRIAEHEAAETARQAKAEAERSAAQQAPAPLEAPAPARAETRTTEPVRAAAMPAIKTRPSDAEIIEVLALHYRVHESKVIEWIITMDMESASRRMLEAI